MRRRDFLRYGAGLGAFSVIPGFVSPRYRPSFLADTSSQFDDMVSGMAAGETQKMSDASTLVDVAPTIDKATFAINQDGTDWSGDFDTYGGGIAAVGDPISVIRSWAGAAVVNKPGHKKIYICGQGGHGNYGGNEAYYFDLDLAAASINLAGPGGAWARANEPARLSYARDPGSPTTIVRGYNPNYPYTHNISDNTQVWQDVYDPADVWGLDQRHAGPPSTHMYGAHIYDPDLDAIVVYGAGMWQQGGPSAEGFWFWSIPNQRWELTATDHALGPGVQATVGDVSVWDAFGGGNAVNFTLIKVGANRYWYGWQRGGWRIRLDGTDWITNLGGVNTNVQSTGGWSLPGGHTVNQQLPAGFYSIGARYDAALPPGDKNTDALAAFVFLEDNSAGGGGGWVVIWPRIDQDEETTNTNTFIDYANNVPNSGGNQLPDLSSGVYSLADDAFLFSHRPWLADFAGQIYACDRSTFTWSTYLGAAAGGPTQADPGRENGLRGKFSYIPGQGFLWVFETEVWFRKEA